MNVDPGRHVSHGSVRRKITFTIVAFCHIAVVLGPLGLILLHEKMFPPKQNIYRVKIGGRELSTAPEVGPPERKRPSPRSSSPEPRLPKPKTKPKPVPRPEPVPPKPKPTVKPEPVLPKAKTRPTPKAKPKAVSRPQTQNRTRPKRQTARETAEQRQARELKELESQVYQPPEGSNTNMNVPIGSHDRGQQRGKQDNRTPGGGASVAVEKYGKNIGLYLESRWIVPPRSLTGNGMYSVTIELTVTADGRIQEAKLTRSSGIPAADESVRRLLSQLDRVPVPPDGAVAFEIDLKPKRQ